MALSALFLAAVLSGPAAAQSPGAALQVPLSPLHNASLRGSKLFPVNGIPVRLSFVYTRKDGAFAVLRSDKDGTVQLVNVRRLLSDLKVEVSGAGCKVGLDADLGDLPNSRLYVTGPGLGDGTSLTMRELIKSTVESGPSVAVGGGVYRVLYYDEVTPDGRQGRLDATRQNVALVAQKGKDFKYTVIPFESVPAGQWSEVKLDKDQRVFVRRVEGNDGPILEIQPVLQK